MNLLNARDNPVYHELCQGSILALTSDEGRLGPKCKSDYFCASLDPRHESWKLRCSVRGSGNSARARIYPRKENSMHESPNPLRVRPIRMRVTVEEPCSGGLLAELLDCLRAVSSVLMLCIVTDDRRRVDDRELALMARDASVRSDLIRFFVSFRARQLGIRLVALAERGSQCPGRARARRTGVSASGRRSVDTVAHRCLDALGLREHLHLRQGGSHAPSLCN